jgi:hypothetical protein
LCFTLLHCSTSSGSASPVDAGPCPLADASGKTATLALAVSDTAFAPGMLTADNNATVTLTLINTGTKQHGFAVQCMPTAGANGCSSSCFPGESTIQPIGPDASATTTFVAPSIEGTYTFGSNATGDTMTGQFDVN